MILVDGDKYACVQCIRGHRSSTCKHASRPLVQVRSRGRPSLNAGHRIAVTKSEVVLSRSDVIIQDSINAKDIKQKEKVIKKEEIDEDSSGSEIPTPLIGSKSSCCSSKKPLQKQRVSCCSSKQSTPTSSDQKKSCCSTTHSECGCGKNGIIMLRASKREFVDVKNGNIDYVGPYNDSSLNKFKVGNINPKRIKHTKNSTCSSISNQDNRLRLLKQIKMNEFDYQVKKEQDLDLPQNHVSRDHLAIGYPLSFPSYTTPLSHTITTANTINALNTPNTPNTSNSTNTINTTQHGKFDPSFPFPCQFHFQPQPQEKIYDVVYSQGCADECHCGPDCTCPGCLIHRTNEELKEYGMLDPSPSSTPSETRTSPKGYDLINLESIDQILLHEMFEQECFCNADECCCYNCAKHGISEGIRLIDGVRVSQPDGSLNFGKEHLEGIPNIQTNLDGQSVEESCCGNKDSPNRDTFGVLAPSNGNGLL